MNFPGLFFLSLLITCFNCSFSQVKTDPWLEQLFREKGSDFLLKILSKPDTFQYQVIYTKIERDNNGQARFTDYYLNVDRNRYFNPASTVKLPTALAALEKLNEMEVDGVNKNTVMLTDSSWHRQTRVVTDTSNSNGFPSVAHYIKKIFLVSDNDAYNRLYEFVGQETLNRSLHEKGYNNVRITRRFVGMNEEENRHTNAVRFIKSDKQVYYQPAATSNFTFDFSRKVLIGNGHWDRNDSLVNSPMDFTTHNNLPLEDLNKMLRGILFPESIPESQRFHLTENDRQFLLEYMSKLPSESHFPNYDTTEFFDSYAKFFFKSGKKKIPEHIKIYNKTGWSYGFLTDASYVHDRENNIEFMLSAVIYVNADGILNDNRYEYQQLGYPFFGEIFRVIYEYERE